MHVAHRLKIEDTRGRRDGYMGVYVGLAREINVPEEWVSFYVPETPHPPLPRHAGPTTDAQICTHINSKWS